jgi:phospholipid transport system substrate-binding protein
LLLVAAPAPSTGPLGVVQAADAQVELILASKEDVPRRLAAQADDFIDFAELARRALGAAEWKGLSKAERDAFTKTMKGVLRASYAQKALGDGRGGAKVKYGAETVENDEATVPTTLQVKDEAIPVVYRLYRAAAGKGWKIYDVITDDVSLVATYNDQFRRVIAKSGFAGLLKSLQARQAQLEQGSPPAGKK